MDERRKSSPRRDIGIDDLRGRERLRGNMRGGLAEYEKSVYQRGSRQKRGPWPLHSDTSYVKWRQDCPLRQCDAPRVASKKTNEEKDGGGGCRKGRNIVQLTPGKSQRREERQCSDRHSFGEAV